MNGNRRTNVLRLSAFMVGVAVLALGATCIGVGVIGRKPTQAGNGVATSSRRMATSRRGQMAWERLLARKQAFYREQVKPAVDNLLPAGSELPDLPK